jgi:hypothetical protein
MFFFTIILIGWKKFATLLPNNWLAETPQTLASRGLADSRRKGSGFLKSNGIFKRKNSWLVLFRTLYKTSISFMFFPVLINGWRNLLHSSRITGWPRPRRRLCRGGLADSRRKGSGFLKSTRSFFNKTNVFVNFAIF